MFTPPPSPAPPRTLRCESPPSDADEESKQFLSVPSRPLMKSSPSDSTSTDAQNPSPSSHAPRRYTASLEEKRSIARRTKWTILLIPAVLMFITATTRYISHPALLDALSADWSTRAGDSSLSSLDLHLHKRHANPDPAPQQADTGTTLSASAPTESALVTASSASASASASASSSSSASQTIPTIPSAPPVLPTPFPQPLDVSLSQNFTTVGCQNFFQNMTNSSPFRSCRAFSLLVQTSSQFIQAQSNVTELNAVLWGTCNTDTSFDQCNTNMAGYASTLQDVCSKELSQKNAIVKQTLNGLLSYTLMRNTACLADPTTNAYCYVEAVNKASDLYFYNLPFGHGLPNSTVPSCSACTKSVMSLYSQNQNLTTLAGVYASAASLANEKCGAGYVQIKAVNGAGREPVAMFSSWILLGVIAFWALW